MKISLNLISFSWIPKWKKKKVFEGIKMNECFLIVRSVQITCETDLPT